MATPQLVVQPARLNILLQKGSTLDRTLVYYSDDTLTVPVDLTGYTARMHVRGYIDDPAPTFTLTTLNGGIVLGGAAGTVRLVLADTATVDTSWEVGVYDIELLPPGGGVRPWLSGGFILTDEVTR